MMAYFSGYSGYYTQDRSSTNINHATYPSERSFAYSYDSANSSHFTNRNPGSYYNYGVHRGSNAYNCESTRFNPTPQNTLAQRIRQLYSYTQQYPQQYTHQQSQSQSQSQSISQRQSQPQREAQRID